MTSPKNFVITLFCRPDLTVGTVIELGNLNAVGGNWISAARRQVVAVKQQRKGAVTIMDSRAEGAMRIFWHTDLWCCLVDYGVPRSETNRNPARFLIDLYKQKISRSNEQKSNRNHKKESHSSSVISQN